MRSHRCGERFGACGRGPLPRSRDGMGLRLRLLRAGARSSLTERLSPHEKRGPCREIAALERRRARLPQGRQLRKARAPGGAPAPSLFSREGWDGRMLGRAKSAGARTMAFGQ